jgi:integrase
VGAGALVMRLHGARVGELTQLRVQDIERRTYGPVLRITPDAGPVKPAHSPFIPI